jgi:hypothetical protein
MFVVARRRLSPLAQARLPHSIRALVLVAAVTGCGRALPEPSTAEQPNSAYHAVPFPPPPARPEFVPEQPHPDAVWIDGEWRWRGVRWGWIYGRWVIPPDSALWSPWSWKRRRDGQLFVAPGTWRDGEGQALEHPEALRLAGADEGDVIEDEGLLEEVGPNTAAMKKDRVRRRSGCDLDCPMSGDAIP